MHLVGAVLTFGVGALYILVQTLLSLNMQPHVHSKSIYLVRLGIGVWTLCSIISSILHSSPTKLTDTTEERRVCFAKRLCHILNK